MKSLHVALFVLFAAALAACSKEQHLSALGEVSLDLDAATSRFGFPTTTRLFDDRTAPANGSFAGHCSIRAQENAGDVVSIGLSRTGSASDLGLRALEIMYDDVSNETSGSIQATAGARVLSGSVGSACALDVLHYDAEDGEITVDVRCTVSDSNGSGQLAGTIELAGCTTVDD